MGKKETTLGGVVGSAAAMCLNDTAPLPQNQVYLLIQDVALLNFQLDRFKAGVDRLLATAKMGAI